MTRRLRSVLRLASLGLPAAPLSCASSTESGGGIGGIPVAGGGNADLGSAGAASAGRSTEGGSSNAGAAPGTAGTSAAGGPGGLAGAGSSASTAGGAGGTGLDTGGTGGAAIGGANGAGTAGGSYRTYVRPRASGGFKWDFWVSNGVDSTYGGGQAKPNQIGGTWRIEAAYVAEAGTTHTGGVVSGSSIPVTFGGAASKSVGPGDRFWSDPVELELSKASTTPVTPTPTTPAALRSRRHSCPGTPAVRNSV